MTPSSSSKTPETVPRDSTQYSRLLMSVVLFQYLYGNPPSHHAGDPVDEGWKRTQPVTFDRALPTNFSDLQPGSRTNKRNYIHQQYSPSIQPPENLPLPTLVSRTAKKLATRPEHDMKSRISARLSVQYGLLKICLHLPHARISNRKASLLRTRPEHDMKSLTTLHVPYLTIHTHTHTPTK